MEKAVDWQEWIFAAKLKSGSSWRKIMLCEQLDHYSIIPFQFLNCNQILSANFIILIAATCGLNSS